MPSEKATAIVLRVVEFSETSSVVTLFTREFGKLRAIAKGARRPKGPFESALDLLALCRIVFRPKSSDTLDLLTEAKLERRYRPFDRDLASLYAGYYVAELLGELTDLGDPQPDLFDSAVEVLGGLSAGRSPPALVLRFELVALGILGHLPSLERCVTCGKVVDRQGRLAFGPLAGGVLCPGCRAGQRHVVSVSPGVVETLRHYADRTPGWRSGDAQRASDGELRAVVNHYLNHLVGRSLRMPPYLSAVPPCRTGGAGKERAGPGRMEPA